MRCSSARRCQADFSIACDLGSVLECASADDDLEATYVVAAGQRMRYRGFAYPVTAERLTRHPPRSPVLPRASPGVDHLWTGSRQQGSPWRRATPPALPSATASSPF